MASTTVTSSQSDSPTSQSDSPSSPKETVQGKKYYQSFRDNWLLNEKYAQWLRRDPVDPRKGHCSVCRASFLAKRSSLDDHAKGIKHLRKMKDKLVPSAGGKPLEKRDKRKTSRSKERMRAEIKLGAWASEHNIPHDALDHLPDVLAKTFSDSQVAQSLHLKCARVSDLMANVIGEGFIEDTEKEINTDDCKMGKVMYSLILDVITERSALQLAVVIKYFDGPVLKTRLLEVVSASTEGDGASLFDVLSSVVARKGLNWANCVGWCAETSDAMHGDHPDSVKNRLLILNPNMAAVNRSWHSAAAIASRACEVFPGSLEKLVQDVYNYFAHSKKRADAFRKFQELTDTEPRKLLKPRQTRWLSLNVCITRLLEQWDALLLFMHAQDLGESSAQASGILAVMRDPYTKIYLEFLSFVLPKILNLNKAFESSGVAIHTLAESLTRLYSDILSLYVEPSVVQQARSSLVDFDPSSEALMLPLASTYIGVAAFQSLTALTSANEMKVEFLQVCRAFLVTACEEIKRQFPLSDPMLVAAGKLNVHSAKSGHVASFVGEVLPHFPAVIAGSHLQRVDNLWRQIPYEDDLPADSDFLPFWQRVFGDAKFEPLSYCVKAILLIPLANADSEHIFSELRQIKSAHPGRLTADSLTKLAVAREVIRETGCAAFEPSETMYRRFKNATMPSAEPQECKPCLDGSE